MSDPVTKVKKMIKDLIVKLMEEAHEEAEQKGWCDTEMSTNEQTRTEKSEKVSMLKAPTCQDYTILIMHYYYINNALLLY